MKARRMATRRRAQSACLPCKARKARCSDFRPCARCSQSRKEDCLNDVVIRGGTMSTSMSAVYTSTADRRLFAAYSSVGSPRHKIPSPADSLNFNSEINPKPVFVSNNYTQSLHEDYSQRRFQMATSLNLQESTSTIPQAPSFAVPADKQPSALLQSVLPPAFHTCTANREPNGVRPAEWVWEAAAGPGQEDPFREDWRRCQLLWGKPPRPTGCSN